MRKLAFVLLALAGMQAAAAQQPTQLRVAGPGGAIATLPVAFHRGYAAVPLRGLDRVGWTVGPSSEGGVARIGKDSIVVRERTPFFVWGTQLLQLTDEPYRLGDYAVGERIDHVDRTTVEEAEHMLATRLWQNTSRVHFDASLRQDGRRLVYGGHVISLARALTFNGLANAQLVAAINAGAHANPCFAGDTVGAWSEVLDKAEVAPGIGALTMALITTRLNPWKRPGVVLLCVVAGFGLATIGFGLSRAFPLSLFCLFLTGVFDNISVVIRLTLEQTITPDHLRGRVSAINCWTNCRESSS